MTVSPPPVTAPAITACCSSAEKPGTSDVIFFIDYEFKSMILQMLMGHMFDAAFRCFTDAFEKRAATIYRTA